MKPETRTYWLRFAGAIAFLVVLAVVINLASGGSFLHTGNVANVLKQISYNFIVGVGETFVIITAGIDLSVGSLISLTGVVMALFANATWLHGFPLIAATLLVGLAVGAAAGFVNAVPVVKLNLPPFITTLAMMQIALGISYILSGGQPVHLHTTDFQNTGYGSILGTPVRVPVVWMVVILILTSILLMRTKFGRYVFAIGGNEEAARLAGISVGRVKTAVYILSGMCAAIASFLYMASFSTGSPQTATGNEMLYAIAAVVVGGTSLMGGRGSIIGTFFGALLIGFLNNSMNLLQINSYLQWVVLGCVVLLAVVLDELRKRYLRRA